MKYKIILLSTIISSLVCGIMLIATAKDILATVAGGLLNFVSGALISTYLADIKAAKQKET